MMEPSSVSLPGILDEYRLVRRIGRGGMGEVFLAHDTVLDRPVAVKFIGALRPDSLERERFLVEARAAARLQHPNVLTIYRVGEIEQRPYIISEFIRGESLEELPKPIPWQRVLKLGVGLARGLAAAHRRGVLHRDIKPGNAILAEDGEVKILDFGLAKLVDASAFQSRITAAMANGSPSHAAGRRVREARTLLEAEIAMAPPRPLAEPGAATDTAAPRVDVATPSEGAADPGAAKRVDITLCAPAMASDDAPPSSSLTIAGTVMGTPDYMPPEAWRGEPATRRSDIYSLGALLFELCSGHPPNIDVPFSDKRRVLQERDTPRLSEVAPDVDARLAAVIDRCLHRDPAQRFASGDELLGALEPITPEASSAVLPEGNPYRGLAAFDAEHRALFFGRHNEIRALLERLRSQPFVLVAGDSGVGKSSLCRAGLLPLITEGALGDGRAWSVAHLVPGRSPLAALIAAIAASLSGSEPALAERVGTYPHELARALRKEQGEGTGLLIFIDQLEELCTMSDPAEAASVSEALGNLASGMPGVRLLMTVRGDFLTRVAALPGLGEEIARALYILRPLSPERIREAIVGPAHAKGVAFESEMLIDSLVASSARADGGLPLLQFALAELWDARGEAGTPITAWALQRIGGVTGVLARHADQVVLGLLPAQRIAARRILTSLVGAENTRVRRNEAELCDGNPDARAALNAMIRGRLLVARETEHGTAYEVAHEALLRDWEMLRRWLDEQAGARAVTQRLRAAAAEWERLGRSPDVLWSARQLGDAKSVSESDLAAFEAAFLRASLREIRRRRWARTAITLVILLAATGLVGIALRARWAAEEQANLAHQLGQDAEAMELFLRSSYTLPLHDVRREKTMTLERMRGVEARMGRMGRAGEGSGHYALGRGNMALHRYDEALSHLRAAWNSGYRTPEVEYALGLVLGKLYKKTLEDAQRMPDARAREARIKEAEEKYLGPALEHVEGSRASLAQVESPLYVEGLIAFYGRRYDEALEKARRAFEASPWLYEAKMLEGDIIHAQGDAKKQRGGYDEALHDYTRAAEAYRTAEEMARSEPTIYQAEAQLWRDRIEAEVMLGRSPKASFDEAIPVCDNALKADPDNANTYTTKSLIYWWWGGYQNDNGEDPRATLEAAIEAAEQAVKRNPGDAGTYDSIGNAYFTRAIYESKQGMDPRTSLDRGEESLRKAIQINPDFTWPWNDLGSCALARADYEVEHGLDPRGSLVRAVQYFQAAISTDPTYVYAMSNICGAFLRQGQYEVEIGLSPEASLDRALGSCETTLRINPGITLTHNIVAQIHLIHARYEQSRGQDPRPHLERAASVLTRLVQGSRADIDTYANLAEVHRAVGLYLVEQRADPAEALGSGKAAVQKMLEIAPNEPRGYLLEGKLLSIAGRFAMQEKKDPVPFFRDAAGALDRTLALRLNSADVYQTIAELYRFWAEHDAGEKGRAREHIAKGLVAAEEALAINPKMATALSVRGVLHVLEARAGQSPKEPHASAYKAQASLEEAVRKNALLQRQLGAWLDEARRLATRM
jgi:serine/threonine protein kinase/tetratricopeptide (TPR) repeat protein